MINMVNIHDENIYGIFYIDKEETLEFFYQIRKNYGLKK